jgi:hypothetical protein
MEGVWRVYGGCMEGERWGKGGGPGAIEKALQCAILAHNPLLVSKVKSWLKFDRVL